MNLRNGRVKRGLSPSRTEQSLSKKRKLVDKSSVAVKDPTLRIEQNTKTPFVQSNKSSVSLPYTMNSNGGKGKGDWSQSSRTESSSSKKRKLSGVSSKATNDLTKQTKQDKKIPSTKSNGSSTSLPYMGLPLEIWCQICRLVVEKESPISVSFRRINHSPRRCNSRTTLALASTCRLMYKVAIPFYYSRNTFFIPGRTVEQKSFLASIGPINRDLITSLEIDAYYPPRDIWQQISKLAATKNFSALYHHGLIRSSPPGEVDGEASFDYCRIIDSFSAVLGDKKEPPKSPNCTINLHNSDRRRLDSGLVKTDGARFWKRHTYPWGVLEAIFQGKRMTINIERSGKEKRS